MAVNPGQWPRQPGFLRTSGAMLEKAPKLNVIAVEKRQHPAKPLRTRAGSALGACPRLDRSVLSKYLLAVARALRHLERQLHCQWHLIPVRMGLPCCMASPCCFQGALLRMLCCSTSSAVLTISASGRQQR